MQSLYVELVDDHGAPSRPIHLGFQSGPDVLRGYLNDIGSLGINHMALKLRFNSADIETTLKRLTEYTLPDISN